MPNRVLCKCCRHFWCSHTYQPCSIITEESDWPQIYLPVWPNYTVQVLTSYTQPQEQSLAAGGITSTEILTVWNQSGITWRDRRNWDNLNPQKNCEKLPKLLYATYWTNTMKLWPSVLRRPGAVLKEWSLLVPIDFHCH